MDYDIYEAFEAIENELIESQMRNFRHHRAEEDKEGYKWSQWQGEQLKSLEKYRRNNAKKFGSKFSSINSKVADMLKKAREDGNAEQEVAILEAIKNGFKVPDIVPDSMTGEFFKLNDRKLDALIKATVSDLEKAETAILRRADDQYRKAIFNAQVYANTGAGTYEKAVDMACRDMLRAGLACVEYKNGAIHQLSDYAEMAIRTASKRAYLYGEGEKRKEFGITTVVVNSRQGGCSQCAKYIGKIFIDDVYSGGKKSDGNYPLLSDAIKGGLFHPRCKDSTSTYYEGITTLQKVSAEEMAEMDRREKLEEQQSYCKNQAKKNQRIAEHSLDKDNQRTFQKRADAYSKKADEIGGKIAESLEKSDGSGIIKSKIVNGKNVIGVWKPREGFDSLIDDIVDYQGFNGKPTIITNQEKFDSAVKNDHFLAERTIRADNKDILDSYVEQLKATGDDITFYVNCGEGGAQYGQGMYCAADYTKGKTAYSNFEHEIWEYGINQGNSTVHETIWMTLEPSAKIFELPYGEKAYEYISEVYVREYMKNNAGEKINDVLDYIEKCEKVDALTFKESNDYIDQVYVARNEAFEKVKELKIQASNATMYIPEGKKFQIPKDPGVLAAEMGYDAINAVGHGATGSYTVVLNRTKLIIFGGDKYVY